MKVFLTLSRFLIKSIHMIGLGSFILISSQLFSQNEERRQVNNFDEVSVLGNIVLHLIPDDREGLELVSSRESPRNIITEMKGSRLVIKMRAGIYEYQKVHAYLSYLDLKLIKAQAGARVKSEYVIQGERVEIHAGSGARVSLEVEANSLSLKTGEGAEIDLQGRSRFTELTAKTGGVLYAGNLMSEEVYVKVHTGGEASVYARESIEGKAGTGGVLRIEGNPKRDHVYTNLGGQVWK